MSNASVRLGVLCVAGLLGVACSQGMDEGPETIRLQVQGTVYQPAPSSAPIGGARVILGGGGYFTASGGIDTVITDPDGRYRIERDIEDPRDSFFGCQLWLRARAAGFESSPGGSADSPYSVRCTEQLQRINIPLNPQG